MNKIILNIGGMSCQHCAKAIERALLDVAGVDSVQVELANSRAIVTCDGAIFDVRVAEKAIIEQGYDFLGVVG